MLREPFRRDPDATVVGVTDSRKSEIIIPDSKKVPLDSEGRIELDPKFKEELSSWVKHNHSFFNIQSTQLLKEFLEENYGGMTQDRFWEVLANTLLVNFIKINYPDNEKLPTEFFFNHFNIKNLSEISSGLDRLSSRKTQEYWTRKHSGQNTEEILINNSTEFAIEDIESAIDKLKKDLKNFQNNPSNYYLFRMRIYDLGNKIFHIKREGQGSGEILMMELKKLAFEVLIKEIENKDKGQVPINIEIPRRDLITHEFEEREVFEFIDSFKKLLGSFTYLFNKRGSREEAFRNESSRIDIIKRLSQIVDLYAIVIIRLNDYLQDKKNSFILDNLMVDDGGKSITFREKLENDKTYLAMDISEIYREIVNGQRVEVDGIDFINFM